MHRRFPVNCSHRKGCANGFPHQRMGRALFRVWQHFATISGAWESETENFFPDGSIVDASIVNPTSIILAAMERSVTARGIGGRS